MADIASTMPLTAQSVQKAYDKIRNHVHVTPLLTSKTLDRIASTPSASSSTGETISPKFRLYFKCENMQRIGAFKARGGFHAMSHLIEELGIEEVRRRGVVTHSSGNHAQALALAASEFGVPSHIVMPTISTPSKIAGTQTYSSHVVFSGSTSQEREAKVQEVIEQTGAIFVPPYDHPDIMLGQGTAALELHKQYMDLRRSAAAAAEENGSGEAELDAILTPLGGGGLLSGTAIYFSDKPSVKVFGAEPSFQGANDGQRGLNANPPKRIETVKSLTIGDGLRTPLGKIPWEVFTTGTEVKPKRLENIYSVTEEQIKDAMRLVLERMKVFVEPSAVVPLAVVLYDEDFRRWVYEKQKEEGGDRPWDVAIVFSGGNTTVEAIIGLFGDEKSKKGDDKQEGGEASGGKQREEGKVGMDGKAVAENVAG